MIAMSVVFHLTAGAAFLFAPTTDPIRIGQIGCIDGQPVNSPSVAGGNRNDRITQIEPQ